MPASSVHMESLFSKALW